MPPSAAIRSVMPCTPVPMRAVAGSKPLPSSSTVNVRLLADPAQGHPGAGRLRVLRDVLQRLTNGEVHGGLGLLGVPSGPVRLDGDGERRLPGLGLEGGVQPVIG